MVGWLGFYGILSTDIGYIMPEIVKSLLKRPMTYIKEIIRYIVETVSKM